MWAWCRRLWRRLGEVRFREGTWGLAKAGMHDDVRRARAHGARCTTLHAAGAWDVRLGAGILVQGASPWPRITTPGVGCGTRVARRGACSWRCPVRRHGHMRSIMATQMATAQDGHYAQPCPHARHNTRRAGGGMAGVLHLVRSAASKTVPIYSLLPDIAYALRLYFFVFASSICLHQENPSSAYNALRPPVAVESALVQGMVVRA